MSQGQGFKDNPLYKSNKQPPCRNCEERSAECHSTCERYKEWSAEERKVKNEIYKNKVKYYIPLRVEIDRTKEALRRRRKK